MFLNVYVFFLVSTLQGDVEQLPNVMEENRQSACAKRNSYIKSRFSRDTFPEAFHISKSSRYMPK